MSAVHTDPLAALLVDIPAGAFVVGTDTGVGKTWVSCRILRRMKSDGLTPRALKPVETGVDPDGTPSAESDAYLLWNASGADERPGYGPESVAIDRFADPVSPHIAYRKSGRDFHPGPITARVNALRETGSPLIVESAGGALTPLSRESTNLDLAALIGLPLIIICDRRLGAFSRVNLIVEAARSRALEIAAIIVNPFDAQDDLCEWPAAEYTAVEALDLTGIRSFALPVDDDLDRAIRSAEDSSVGSAGDAIASDHAHIWHPFTQHMEHLAESPPLVIERAQGNHLIDEDGRRYLDGVSSLWVNLHGHRVPRIDRAVRAQLGKVAHSTMLGLINPVAAELAGMLCDLAPAGLSRVFYSDSGSTAVESAMKIAVQYQAQSGRQQRNRFMSFDGAYHGDTLGAVAVGGHDLFHSKYHSMLFPVTRSANAYCYRCSLGLDRQSCHTACLDEFQKNFEREKETLAAVIIEPMVQGAAGIIPWPPGFLARMRQLTEDAGVLLIADEVATGFGRTGTLFACEQESVSPDLLCLAKGISGGYLPLAATLATEDIFEAFQGAYEEHRTFYHGHSYTGNPLACAAGIASLNIFREDAVMEYVSNVLMPELGAALEPLAQLPHVGEVRRVGTMTGIEIVRDKQSREPFPEEMRVGRRVCLAARKMGVIVRPLGDTLVLMPPLSFKPDEIHQLVSAIGTGIAELFRNSVAGARLKAPDLG